METNHDPQLKTASDCDCCQLSTDDRNELFGCSERLHIFTPQEQEILKEIREVGRRARLVKAQLQQAAAEFPAAASERKTLQEELASLRQLRAHLERRRLAAAEERMRQLGHA